MSSGLAFGTVRESALENLHRGSRERDGEQLLCVIQEKHADHVAIYCNTLQHTEALETLLDFGTWCDDVELPAQYRDTPEDDLLFRFYTVAFLLIEECLMDLRALAKAAGGPAEPKTVGDVIGKINRIWKHRDLEQGVKGAFHREHHHGPYYFADVGDQPLTPATAPGAVPLVVPSLGNAVQQLVDWLATIIAQLEARPEAREMVEQKWSSVVLE